jgi:2',3'-cyclic-nucleotide 2'-phosphodiesterase (5'-nucleotidase family)
MTDHRPNIGKLTKRGSIQTLFLTGILLIFSGCFTTKSVSQNATTFTVSNNTAVYDSVPDDSLTIALIKPYKATMEAQMSEYIATIDSPFSNAFFVGNLGRLAADYMLLSANAISIKEFGVPCHFAISNNGGFRTGFYPGPVTMQQLFEVMPFENELVLAQLPGIYVDSLFQYIAQLQGTPASGFLMSYSKGSTRKDNRYQSLKLNAQPVNSIQDLLNPQYTQPLDTRRDYLIAVNSYMVVGGDGFTMLKHAKKIHYTGINLRTVLAQQLKAEYEANKFIDPRKQIRIYHEPQ